MSIGKIIRWTSVTTACALAVVLLAVCVYQRGRVLRCEEILSKVDQLGRLTPPEGRSPLEWAALIYWTHNLHCESSPQTNASYSTLYELERFLDKALIDGPTSQTIDELWQRYEDISDGGRTCRLKYESVRDEEARMIAIHGDKYLNAREYRVLLRSTD